MSRGRIALLAAMACVMAAASVGHPSGANGVERLRYDAAVMPLDRAVCVGRRFFEAGSDSLVLAGRTLVRGVDYTVDAAQGCFFLLPAAFPDSLPPPFALAAWYRPLPFRLEPLYARRDLSAGRGVAAKGTDSTVVAPTPGSPPAPVAAETGFAVRPSLGRPDESEGRPELTLGGSKTFTVELGSNRDLTLKQTLDMSIEGAVSRDVHLRAILSDRDLPFQPEGSSAELEELDKVLIELTAPGARFGLGDQELTVDRGTLGRFARRLQGLLAEGRKGGGEGRFVGAAGRGEFRTYEFLGTEGKQGPYALVDRAGGRGIVVVAGSERITLDGELLTRGLDNDYIIDYSRAELTFTARRPIGERSRIAADYEFAAGGYRRSLYLAESRGKLSSGALDVGFLLARESDDRGRPLSGELSDAEKLRLAAAGDSVLSGGGGVRFVGEGNGRYDDAFDAVNSRSYYRWAGRGEGRYEITFVEVGPGIGDYVDSLAAADTIYVYRGPEGGRFAPAGALTSPGQQSMGQVDGRLRLGDRATIDGEFALTGQDLNTFSPIDDDDNAGNAGRLNLAVAPVPLGFGSVHLGDVAATAEHRHLSEDFAPLGRIDASFSYDRDWNLPPRTSGLAEDRTGGVLTWRPVLPLSLIGDVAHLSGSGRSSDRRNARAELSGKVSATGSLLIVDSAVDSGAADGRLEREALTARSRIKFLVPSARYEAEERTDPVNGNGRRYWLAGGDLGFDGLGPVRLSVGAERRVDDLKAPASSDTLGWREETDAFTKRGSLSLANWKALSATLLYQSRDVDRSDGGTNASDLAQFDLSRRSSDASFGADFHYAVGTNGVESRTRMLVFVGEGMGSYDEFGNLFPGGGYDLVEGPLGEEEVVSDVDASLHLELVPYRSRGDAGGTLGWLRRNIGWNANGRVEERSRLPLGRLDHLFDFGAFQDTASSLGGRVQLRQTAEIFPSSRVATIRLSQEYDDIANYQFSNFREDRNESLYGAGVRWTPSPPWTLEGTQKWGTRSQEVTAGEESPRVRRAHVLESIGQGTWRPSPIVRALLALTWHRESESDAAYATAFDVNPRLSWSIGQKGRLEAGGRWVEATRHGGYTGIGGFSSLTLQDRLEMTLDGDYRVLQVLTVGAGLAGRRPEGSRFVVDGRMEVRAYF